MQMHLRIATTILALGLAACGTSAGTTPTATMTASTATTAAASATPSPTPATITVSDAWARAAVSGASDATAAPMGSAAPGMGGAMGAPGTTGATGNSAVYMTIKSTSSSADRLVKAASDVAGATELHTAAMVNGVMQMRPVEAIDIPAGGVATLAPGGFHVMLIGLKKDLKVGDTVKLTLTFERFGTLTIAAPVRAA